MPKDSPRALLPNQESKLLSKLSAKIEISKVRLEKNFNRRLILGTISGAFLILSFIDVFIPWTLFGFLFSIFIFVFFAYQTKRYKNYHLRLTELEKHYLRQHYRRHRDFEALQRLNPISTEHTNGLALDIDLIGEHSLMALMNETFSDEGQEKLKLWLSYDYANKKTENQRKETTLQRQRWIQELSKYSAYCRRWLIEGKVLIREINKLPSLEMELNEAFTPQWFSYAFSAQFFVFFLFLLALGQTLITNQWGYLPQILLIATLMNLLGYQVTKHTFHKLLSLSHGLTFYVQLSRRLETWPTATENIPFSNIHRYKPSRLLHRLESQVAWLSVQAHPLILILVNIFFPWSTFFSWRAEKVRKELSQNSFHFLNELITTEVLMSLALFSKNLTQTWPQFIEGDFQLQEAYHPLLKPEAIIKNNFYWGSGVTLALITGSNMAGKSTFIRTVAMNQQLALMGAPVFAASMITSWRPVITCIRVSDSLREGFSYFLAETLRLAEILKRAQNGEKFYYFIDEVFKGTNNKERFLGSQTLISELSKTKAQGMITTHDLDLVEIEKRFPAIKNYHFRDSVEGDKMVFPYKIFNGPCPTTNALKIMRTHGIPVPQ